MGWARIEGEIPVGDSPQRVGACPKAPMVHGDAGAAAGWLCFRILDPNRILWLIAKCLLSSEKKEERKS